MRRVKRAAYISAAALLMALCFSYSAFAATFNVTKTADTNDGACDADCSLREAIIASNAAPDPDTINVPAGAYVLNLAGTDEVLAQTGDLNIRPGRRVQILGAGMDQTIIDGNGTDRVFHIRPNAQVRLSGLTVTNGIVRPATNSTLLGGGIGINSGYVQIYECRISANGVAGDSTDGTGLGGGIYAQNKSIVMIENSIIENNRVIGRRGNYSGSGGGIFSYESVFVISGSIIRNNTAEGRRGEFSGSGGGIYVYGGPTLGLFLLESEITGNTAQGGTERYTGEGGGVHLEDTGALSLFSTITNNKAIGGNSRNSGAGGGVFAYGSAALFLRNEITGNTAQCGSQRRLCAYGGGVMNVDSSIFAAGTNISSNSVLAFTDGRAQAQGGGMNNEGFAVLFNSEIANNYANGGSNVFSAIGGGLMNIQEAILFLTDITANRAVCGDDALECALGGGAFNVGHLYFLLSTMSTNTAACLNNGEFCGIGGGLFSDHETISYRSTFSSNTASCLQNGDECGGGGAIYNEDDVMLQNVTISGNRAVSINGPNDTGLGSGAINGGYLVFNNVTMNNNTSTGPLGAGLLNFGGGTTITDSILANSQGGPDCFELSGTVLFTFPSSVVESGNCPPVLYSTDPMLGGLADNGGYTKTHALLAGSPALDTALACVPTSDQRGIPRPQGAACDIGAYEDAGVPTVTLTKTGPAQANPGDTITYTVAVRNTGTVTVYGAHLRDVVPYTLAAPVLTPRCTSLPSPFNSVNCFISEIPPGRGGEITIEMHVDYDAPACSTFINTAELRSQNGPLVIASASTNIPGCDSGGTYEEPFTGPSRYVVNATDSRVHAPGWTPSGDRMTGHNWGGTPTPMMFSFDGSRVEIRADMGPLFGTFKVYIDGEYYGEVDLFSTDGQNGVVVFTAQLPQGDHTITIVPTATLPGITVNIVDFVVYR